MSLTTQKTIGARIAQELNIRPEQVAAAVALLDEGATSIGRINAVFLQVQRV